jgi:hypothetical protein
VEQLTFLGGDESGDCVPLSVHSVSVVSLMTGGDPEVGDVLRHMAATTNGAQAIKPLLSQGSFSKSPPLPFATTLWV